MRRIGLYRNSPKFHGRLGVLNRTVYARLCSWNWHSDRKLSVSLNLLDNVRSMNRDGASIPIILVILSVLPAFQASHRDVMIRHHDQRHGEHISVTASSPSALRPTDTRPIRDFIVSMYTQTHRRMFKQL